MSQVESNTLILAVLATALIVYISCSSACQQRNSGFGDMMNGGMIMLGLKKKIDPVGEGVQRPAGPVRSLINQGATGTIENAGTVRSLVTNKSIGAPPPPPPPGSGQPIRSELSAGAPQVINPRPEYGSKTVGGAPTSTLKDLVNHVVGPKPPAVAPAVAPPAPAVTDATDNRGFGSVQAAAPGKKRGSNLLHKAAHVIKRATTGQAAYPGPGMFEPKGNVDVQPPSGPITGPPGPAPRGPPRGPPMTTSSSSSSVGRKAQGSRLSSAFVGTGALFKANTSGEHNAATNRPEPETSINKNALLDIRGRPTVTPQSGMSEEMLNVSSVTASDLL